MKTNAKQIESIAKLATPKPFDAIQQTYFLGVELIGFNTASDKLVELQKTIDDTKVEKGTRKKAIDLMLKDMIKNNVMMITKGTGKTKCPIRVELKRVLDTSNLAEGTKNNIITAVSFALEHKKPYDIKGPDKYNAAIKAEKEKEKLKSEILKGSKELKDAIPPTTPAATTPAATTPAATTPAATTPAATKVNPPKVESEKATQYMKTMTVLMENTFNLTEARRMLGDEHKKTYDDIIDYVNEIMDLVASLK
jgi:hypothetical protein